MCVCQIEIVEICKHVVIMFIILQQLRNLTSLTCCEATQPLQIIKCVCVCVCSYNLWHMHMPDLSGNPRQLSAETTSEWSRGMTLEHINVMCGNNTNR